MDCRLWSDLHTEFGKFKYNAQDGDENRTLILAGDIGVGASHRAFVEQMCDIFKYVVIVLGNHEFYNNEVVETRERWANIELGIDNLHLLDDETRILDGVRFIGGTLWTDMDGDDFQVKEMAKRGMNDYAVCRFKETGTVPIFLQPHHTVAMHYRTREFIEAELQKQHDGPTVVVTHHLPLWGCIDPQFRGHHLNGAYASNLESFFRDYEFDVWVHGHTHEIVRLEDVYGKRIYCNPRGYVGHEVCDNFDPEFMFQV